MRGYLLPKILTATALAAGAALALGGCGSDPAPDVATAATGTAAPSASASSGGAVAEYVASQREWVKCMRAEGFDYPDPDARGRVNVNLAQIGVTDKADPKFMAAQDKCRKFSREVPRELEEREVLTAEQIAHRRAYAACMRQYGALKFPDPAADGSWPREGVNAGLSEQESRTFYKAGLICEPVLKGKPADPEATEPPGAQG